MHRRRQLHNSLKWGTVLLVIGAFLVPIGSALFVVGWDARQNAIMTTNGELIPYEVDLSKPFNLYLSGGFPIPLSKDELSNGFSLAKFLYAANFTDDQFTIRFNGSRMFVSAVIRNSDNVTIAQIENNEWKTQNPDTLLFWDRNYNAYAFEIIGSNNIPTLQVIMIGPNEIQIGGLFYTKTGRIDIAPLSNGDSVIYVNPSDQQLISANIPTLFKYPALTDPNNLGKMVNPTYPSSDPLAEPTWTIIFSIILAALGAILFSVGFEKRKSANEEIAKMNAQNLSKMAVTRKNASRKSKENRETAF